MGVGGRLLVIIGPTAVGKTALSLELAQTLSGEIISGDSMQVYRGMDIGTAKATQAEQALVPHHLIDLRNPDESFSVADFQHDALNAIENIQSRGKLPIIVGGTGLYVQSIIYYPQYKFAPTEQDEQIRLKWQAYAEEKGNLSLWEQLAERDSQTAKRLHYNDIRRVIRALEVYELTGKPMSADEKEQLKPESSPFQHYILGLTMDRAELYNRINERVDQMVAAGLIDEVARLVDRGVPLETTAMQSLGYKEVIPYLEGEISLNETIDIIKRRTRQFAKRQLTWFRRMEGIHWINKSKPDAAEKLLEIKEFLAGKFQPL